MAAGAEPLLEGTPFVLVTVREAERTALESNGWCSPLAGIRVVRDVWRLDLKVVKGGAERCESSTGPVRGLGGGKIRVEAEEHARRSGRGSSGP